eukprot:scaffold32086_cov183-Amphora_coffeaeformis.AAC.20
MLARISRGILPITSWDDHGATSYRPLPSTMKHDISDSFCRIRHLRSSQKSSSMVDELNRRFFVGIEAKHVEVTELETEWPPKAAVRQNIPLDSSQSAQVTGMFSEGDKEFSSYAFESLEQLADHCHVAAGADA